jgi:3-oxoacyl-[acyl-carrier protein] reductase
MTKKIATEKLSENIVLERNGTCDDVANLVCFLCTEDASYITGQIIKVDGGLLI